MTELDYTEQTSWLLFLFILDKPYRWESWAAPKGIRAIVRVVQPSSRSQRRVAAIGALSVKWRVLTPSLHPPCRFAAPVARSR